VFAFGLLGYRMVRNPASAQTDLARADQTKNTRGQSLGFSFEGSLAEAR
jgi:hypothetical protein